MFEQYEDTATGLEKQMAKVKTCKGKGSIPLHHVASIHPKVPQILKSQFIGSFVQNDPEKNGIFLVSHFQNTSVRLLEEQI